MLIRTMSGLLFVCLGFLSGSNVLAQARAQGSTQSFILSDRNIGSLKLDRNTKLELEDLRRAFPGLSVEQKIGQQDGPDFVYYQFSDSGSEVFWIKAEDDNPKNIDSVHVVSAKIRDQYGLTIGSTHEEILRVRPRLTVETDDHFHTYIGRSKENIVYELAVSYRRDYLRGDRKPSKQELGRVIN